MKLFDIVFIGLALAFSGYAVSASDDNQDAVFDRIKHPASVCVKGDPCDPANAVAEETAAALPGQAKYATCAACHGADGSGGVGPAVQGQTADAIADMLYAYKAGETRGAQSALMWGQAAGLSDQDIQDLSEYIATL